MALSIKRRRLISKILQTLIAGEECGINSKHTWALAKAKFVVNFLANRPSIGTYRGAASRRRLHENDLAFASDYCRSPAGTV